MFGHSDQSTGPKPKTIIRDKIYQDSETSNGKGFVNLFRYVPCFISICYAHCTMGERLGSSAPVARAHNLRCSHSRSAKRHACKRSPKGHSQ